ncbi:hypothetical protein F4824DRAFT_495815 [Ustulina deusta]|nr:hypothetical protein F4824DRAFT_495815 [Ustulina deusta]
MKTTPQPKTQVWSAHTTPEVERLTPDHTPERDIAADKTEGFNPAQTVTSLLRLPIVLSELLHVPSELVNAATMDSFLSRRPISDRYQLLELLEKLYQCCHNMCATIQETPGSIPTPPTNSCNTPDEEIEKQSPTETQNDDSITTVLIADDSHQPENEFSDGDGEGSPSPAGYQESTSDTDIETDWEKLAQNDLDDQGFTSPVASLFRPDDVADVVVARSTVKNPRIRAKPTVVTQLRTPLMTPSKPYTPITTKEGTTTIDNKSQPQTPLESSKPDTKEEPTATTSDHPAELMVRQSAMEFASSSLEEIEQLKFPTDSSATYTTLLYSLKETCTVETSWSSGSEWGSLIKSGFADRQKGSIRYALTAIAFARWHHGQTDLLSSMTKTAAAQEVTCRILGAVSGDAGEKKIREIRRKRLYTHLTRGRIWDELVRALGFGILFRNAWSLATSKRNVIKHMISELQKDQEKMNILQHLERQIDLLLENGQTDPAAFKKALQDEIPVETSERTLDISKEVMSLQRQMRVSVSGDVLQVRNTEFRFDIETLHRLGGTEWFSDELILLCLHLADRLPHIRIGFSIPIHQQDRPRKVVAKPFEKAARLIEEWKKAEPNDRLVCLFPLFLHGDHFTLFEVNYGDNAVYHYDSFTTKTHTEIKKACKDQFPELRYVEQVAPHQLDGFSCGPLVIASAYRRMLGREVMSGDAGLQDALKIRETALALISEAWRDEVIVAAGEPISKKRTRELDDERQEKRRKSD